MIKKILFLSCLFFTISLPCEAAYNSWAYKVKIKVNNPTNISVSDYPVRIEVPAKPYIEAGMTNEDLRDIRFSDSSSKALPFWIQTTRNMERNIYGLPVYVKLKNFNSGDNIIYMYFDKSKTKNDKPPKDNYETGDSQDFCGDWSYNGGSNYTSPQRPYSADDCGDNTFDFFAYNCLDTDNWASNNECHPFGGSNAGLNDKWVSKASFSNSFEFYFRTWWKHDPGGEMYAYFLTQDGGNTISPGTIENYSGYRIFFDVGAASTSDYSYMSWDATPTLQLNNGSGWITVAKFASPPWYKYAQKIFKIQVTGTKIKLLLNGTPLEISGSPGTIDVNRTDTLNGGYVGFFRDTWNNIPGGYQNNVTDSIAPVWVVDNYIGAEPIVEFLGHTDVKIKRNQPTNDAAYIGLNIIEATADQQILEDNINGNTLDDYIYSAYPLADPIDQVFKYTMLIKNRGTSSDTFNIDLSITGDPNSWDIAYDYDGNLLEYNLPGTAASPSSGQIINLGGGASKTITITIMPSINALFEGGQGKIVLDYKVTANNDLSFDNVRFVAKVKGNAGCYWQKKKNIDISYNDINGTGDLVDYQVLVNLTGVDFSLASDNGSDLMFTDDEGTMLPFYKKAFNKGAGTGSFWVKVPKLKSGTPGTTKIWMWWGNPDYQDRSDKKATFDLWEDWEQREINEYVGCPDDSNNSGGNVDNCIGKPNDPDGWKNISDAIVTGGISQYKYNWWKIKDKTGKLDGKAVMADKGSSFNSQDLGPNLTGGDIRWKNYEVIYSFYGEHNPKTQIYPHVNFQDAGNTWSMEFGGIFNTYTFRPQVHGLDWGFTQTSNVTNILGTPFPSNNLRYWAKLRVFQNPASGKHLLKIGLADSTPTDIDSDISGADFTRITTAGGHPVAASQIIKNGKIGFQGWDGGFSFDNIRVRKYTEPEPTCTPGSTVSSNYRKIRSLSHPYLTVPLMDERSVMLTASISPWSWKGNLTAIYSDCYILGVCKPGEDPEKLGTISLWGNIDDDTPIGFGDILKTVNAGINRSVINTSNWISDGRYIFTAIDLNGDKKINCTSSNSGECKIFEAANAADLLSTLGVNTISKAKKLINFVRGQYVDGYSRSDVRNECTTPINLNNSPPVPDNCQWKLADIIHSNPVVVGIPNMLYPGSVYSTFVNENRDRDLVAYFASNDGMLHALRMAKYDTTHGYQSDTKATELWAFIPNTILPSLKRTTDNFHEYTTDQIVRTIDITYGNTYRTLLLGGLRTGGQGLFALDVTNPTSPKVLWEINSDTNPTKFEKIGKTWSAPGMGRLCENTDANNKCSGGRWVAIIGSGFDPKDIKNLSKNAYLSIVNLETGDIIKQIKVSDKKGNITTDIEILRDARGFIEKVFFGDYYGAMWRLDISDPQKINSLFGSSNSMLLEEDYMLFKPDGYDLSDINTAGKVPTRPITSHPVISYENKNGGIFWLYFGTGVYDEYDSTYVNQRFYGLKNKTTVNPYLESDLENMTSTTATNTTSKSWMIELGQDDNKDVKSDGTADNTKNSNERILNPPELFGGYAFFTTYTPDNSPCGGGKNRFYAVSHTTGGYKPGMIKTLTANQNIRSVVVSSGGGVATSPMIFVGENAQGEIKSKAVINNSTSSDSSKITVDIKLTKNVFSLWREIR